MKRLTTRNEHGDVTPFWEINTEDGEYDFPDGEDVAYETICRLAAYEDTGLEPEEIDSAFIDSVIEENKRLKAEIAGLQAQFNHPLTLEELRRMDGCPVWNDTMKHWALVVSVGSDFRTVDANGIWREPSDRYYRRKPEEGET